MVMSIGPQLQYLAKGSRDKFGQKRPKIEYRQCEGSKVPKTGAVRKNYSRGTWISKKNGKYYLVREIHRFLCEHSQTKRAIEPYGD